MTKLDNPFNLFAHYTTREKLEFLEDRHPLQYEHILSLSEDKNDQMTFFKNFVNTNKMYPPDQYFFSKDTQQANNSFNYLIEVISLFTCMVTRIMGEDACDNETEITRYVFLFLTRLHQFDMTYRTDEQNQNKSKNPKLFSMPNLLSLLNIVDDNRRFGHLRMMWELGGMGEKSVQKVRDYVINLRPGFAKRVMQNQLMANRMSDLGEDLSMNLSQNPENMIGENDDITDSNKNLLKAFNSTVLKKRQFNDLAGLGNCL